MAKPKRNITKKSNPILNIIPIILLAVFVLMLSLTKLNGEDDLFWHIETGRFIIDNKYIPSTDVFSFATYGEKWIPFEWGLDVITFLIYDNFGFTALYVFNGIIILTIFALLFILLRKFDFSIPFIITLLTILALGIKYRLGIKPHMFTYLFLVLLLYILLNVKYFNVSKKILYIIPFIFIIWANLHMGVLGGILLLFIFLVSEFLNYKKYLSHKKDYLITLLVVFILSLFALFINPHGYNTYIYSYEHTQMKMLNEIYEWYSPFNKVFMGKLFNLIYILFIISGIIVIRYSFKKKDYLPALIYIVFAFYSFRAVRFIVDFELVAFTFFALSWDSIIKYKINSYFQNKSVLSASLISVLLIIFILLTPNNTIFRIIGFNSDFGLGIYEPTFPVKMFKFMKENNIAEIGERPFNTLEYGGYFLHNFPGRKNFIDSRNLNDTIYYNFYEIVNKKPGFLRLMDKYNFDYFIIFRPLMSTPEGVAEMKSIITSYLSEKPDTWKLIYFDLQSMLFVKNEVKFSDIISKFEYKYLNPYILNYKLKSVEEAFEKDKDTIIKEIERKEKEEPDNHYTKKLREMYKQFF